MPPILKPAKRSFSPTPAFLQEATFGHPRDYLGNRHVYTVLSQRARGISLGINLNPDQHCSFACVYCEVNRDRPGRAKQLDLKVMTAELTTMLGRVYENRMREIPWFRKLCRRNYWNSRKWRSVAMANRRFVRSFPKS